ncbi:ABC transporter substrate-binding protein [Haloimpatiens sp. FM7315]|uniref:ABC transporter substrate-binding protein n=1 Tax=Haloimpatiens sp. FM7315 TaxID=3298609 RepID=UPI0035A2BE50
MKEDSHPKKLLQKGLKELCMDGDLSKIKVNFILGGIDQWNRTFGEYVQQMYKKSLGIEVKPEFVEWPVFLNRIDNGKYDVATMYWTSDYNDPSAMFDIYRSDAKIMPTFWSNKKYDDLIDKAKIKI